MVEVAGLEWAIVSVRYDFFDGDFFEDRLYILYIYNYRVYRCNMTFRWWFHRFGIFAPQNMKIVSTNTPVFQMYLVRIGVKGPPNIGAFRRSKDRLTWKTKAYPHRHLVTLDCEKQP